MDFINVITSRRSVRKYNSCNVDVHDIENLLQLASHAPYPKIKPNWETKVYCDANKHLLNRFLLRLTCTNKKIGPSTINSIKTCIKAPVLILVFSQYKQLEESLDDILINHSYIQATGAFIQNILLCATSMKLGSLWVNDILYFADEIENYANNGLKLMSAVLLGHKRA